MKIEQLYRFLKPALYRRSMALFTQVFNPAIGQSEWTVQRDDYDYHQEIANAGFGDMLHDHERNQKYYAALRKIIPQMHSEGKKVNVLDIGTGTGILAMMAVRAGADTVTACEAFMPMANCAELILQANDMGEGKVHLIKKRSTDLKVGAGLDMPQRANLLVAELLDTELIGEGAISIYNHAHAELLTEDVVCIPSCATCFVQVAQSPLATQWNTLKMLPDLDGEPLIHPPKYVLSCKGEATLHDVQLSQLPLSHFRLLTDPIEIFEFDFMSKEKRPSKREHCLIVKAKASGSTDLVFYWWSIKLDSEGEISLSCAPFWAHPDFREQADANKSSSLPLPNVVPWRDHWMQAIYYVPQAIHLPSNNSEFALSCQHDEYSLWFDVFPKKEENQLDPKKSVPRHTCTCNLHMTYSRSRIAQLNQSPRNKQYLRHLEAILEDNKEEKHFLLLGDGCLVGLAAAKLGVTSMICHEPRRFSRRFVESLIERNELRPIVHFVEELSALKEEQIKRISHVFAEPYFLNSILPWDNFFFGTLLLQIIERLSPGVHITPYAARIYAVPVQFLDLHKIRTPIGQCEGFDLRLFDEMVKTSSSLALTKVEAQPLWEYPCRALAKPQVLLHVLFNQFSENKDHGGIFQMDCHGSCNGVALWVDWQLDASNSAKSIVTSGPIESITPGEYIKWDMFVRQGVHLFEKAHEVTKNKGVVTWSTHFKPLAGQLEFDFRLRS